MMIKNRLISKLYLQLLFTIASSLVINVAQAQSGSIESYDTPGSHCVVHTDKPFYVVGEVIWFKAYLPDTLQYRRSLARIDLINQRKEILHTQHVTIDKQNNGQGYYLIPYDFRPDVYYLTVTIFNEDGNRPLTLIYHPVAIYNDLLPVDTTSNDFVNAVKPFPEHEKSKFQSDIDVSMDKSVYSTRQEVELTIKITNQQGKPVPGNLSISVTDKEMVAGYPNTFSNLSKGPDIDQSFLVDNEIAFRGLVKIIADNKVHESDYLAAVMGKEGLMTPFESYEDGSFEIDLPHFEGRREIQLIDYLTSDTHTSLDEPIRLPANMPERGLTYTNEIIRYLEISRKRKKINQLFGLLAFQNLPDMEIPENKWVPDRSLDLSKYDLFESMEEFFVQVVTPLKIKKRKDGSHQIRMVNPDNKPFHPGVPRFIIDGRVVYDPDVAVSLDMKSIARIDLFYFYRNLERQFGRFGSNSGVVVIYTKDGNYHENVSAQSNVFEIYGGLPPANFPVIPAPTANWEQNIPAFQPVIYWNPSVNTNDRGEAKIKFFHSDDRGTFRVEVVGNCGEGEIIIETAEYKAR